MLFEAWHCLKCFWTPLKKVENENKIYVKPGVWITFSIRGCAKKKAAMLAQPKHDSLHIQDKQTAVRGFTGGGRLATSLITETPVQHPKECIIFLCLILSAPVSYPQNMTHNTWLSCSIKTHHARTNYIWLCLQHLIPFVLLLLWNNSSFNFGYQLTKGSLFCLFGQIDFFKFLVCCYLLHLWYGPLAI